MVNNTIIINNNNKIGNCLFALFLIFGFFFFVVVVIPGSCFMVYKSITFHTNCSGYLKRAADSNTVELAREELSKAIKYLEENNITTGTTSVLYKTPDTDIDFFYKNLKSSYDELTKVSSSISQLEKTNVLMKLRETLLDHNKRGDEVTLPFNIEFYPHNVLVFCGGAITTFFGVCFILFLVSLFFESPKPMNRF